ncbi:MAG: hypothetical protein ACI857_000608 [Arenicella sp.]|jgi:hypothetical protein
MQILRNIFCLLVLLLVTSFDGFSQADIQADSITISNYDNEGVKVPFHGSIDIIKNSPEKDGNYFYQAIEIVRFNENKKEINANTQHLMSEEMPPIPIFPDIYLDTNGFNIIDSLPPEKQRIISSSEKTISKNQSSLSNNFSYYFHLSSLFILPQTSKKELIAEMEEYLKDNDPFQMTKEMVKVKIGNKKVMKWRIQSGKTRLDHYIVFGKNYNYLFVSSPYGSDGSIELHISEMELTK